MKQVNIFRNAALSLGAAMMVGMPMASALNQIDDSPVPPQGQGCFAQSVVFFNQGLTALGTPVNAERSNPEEALNEPNAQTPQVVAPVQHFVSLGFGGVVELQFAAPIANGPGADIRIWESSATPSSERSFIEVSQDGLGYVPVGEITADGEVDFGDAFSDYVLFVRITDVTPNNGGGQVTDGYDVDAVECLHGAYEFPSSCYATEVISFNQKKQNDGSTVIAARSNPLKALGMPENDESDNFVSLGFGGDITLKFGSPIKNGAGDDVRVIESTFGSGNANCARYPETIRVFASQDGCNFIYLGEGCQDTDFDLGILGWAQYIKLVDVSDVSAVYQGTPIADAYDVDGVMCLNGYEENPVMSDLMIGYAAEVISFDQGDRKNGSPVVAARSNPENALGMPQNTDVVNFVSLGFGGNIVLKFNYVIFDNPDANDLQLVETTYGSHTCATYGEKVMVEGSLDGINWIQLTSDDVCLDGEVDINNAGAIQYIRITDRSMASQFSGSADAYDVDGVVVINSCNSPSADARVMDNTTTPDEVASLNVYPNPFSDEVRVEITTGDQDRTAQIRVTNLLGQQVFASQVNVASSSNVTEVLNLQSVESGVYILTVETTTSKETLKLIKK